MPPKSKGAGKHPWGLPALMTEKQNRAGLSMAALKAPFISTIDGLDWVCYPASAGTKVVQPVPPRNSTSFSSERVKE